MKEKPHISMYRLAQQHIGSLTKVEEKALQQEILDSPALQKELEERQERFDQLNQHPDFENFLSKELLAHEKLTEERQSSPSSWSRFITSCYQTIRGPSGLVALSGAFALCLLFIQPWQYLTSEGPHKASNFPQDPSQISKSNEASFRMLTLQKDKKQSNWSRRSQRLSAGDLIQFTFNSPHPYYVMLIGLNEKADAYLMFGTKEETSIKLPAGLTKLPKEESFELDEYIGQERFFVLYSDNSFHFRDVRAALQKHFKSKTQSLEHFTKLPGLWKSKTILIHKVKKTSQQQ